MLAQPSQSAALQESAHFLQCAGSHPPVHTLPADTAQTYLHGSADDTLHKTAPLLNRLATCFIIPQSDLLVRKAQSCPHVHALC